MRTVNVYEQEFRVIFKAIETNTKLFDAMIKKIEEFTGSVSQLLDSLAAIPSELPAKVPKRGFFESAFSRKRKPPVEFDSFQPAFSLVWKENVAAGCLDQPGVRGFVEGVKSEFLQKLKQTRDVYVAKGAELKRYVDEKTQELRACAVTYGNKDAQYQQHCAKIEDLKARVDADKAAGKTADQMLRFTQALSEAQTAFPEKQKAAIDAFSQLAQKKADYNLDMERALMLFEELHAIRENAMNDMVQGLVEPVMKLAMEKQGSAENLSAKLEAVSVESDLEPLEKLTLEEKEWPELSFEGVRMDFELTEFMEPQKVFECELKLFGAEAIESYEPKKEGEVQLDAGDIVTVIEQGNSAWKVVNETKHLTGIVPADKLRRVPEMERKLFKVKENYKTDDFEVFAGEYVVSIRTTDDQTKVLCRNAYGGKGTVPVDVLEPQ